MTPLASTTVKTLLLTIAGTVLLELAPMLKSHAIDWWSLGASILPQLGGLLIRLAQPDVKAPPVLDALSFGLLNRNNVATVPDSSVQKADGKS